LQIAALQREKEELRRELDEAREDKDLLEFQVLEMRHSLEEVGILELRRRSLPFSSLSS
jgi:hypothetical protein